MGDAGPDGDGGDAQLGQAALDGRHHAGRHLDSSGDHSELVGQVSIAGRCRHPARAGVGDAGGEGAQADGQPHAERRGQLADGVGERTPLVVGLGAGQDEHRPALLVVGRQQLQLWPDQVGVHPVEHVRHRPTGPVIEQAVDVERRHHLGIQHSQHGRHRAGAAEAGVDPALGGHDQHRAVQLRPGPQLVQIRGRVHASPR